MEFNFFCSEGEVFSACLALFRARKNMGMKTPKQHFNKKMGQHRKKNLAFFPIITLFGC